MIRPIMYYGDVGALSDRHKDIVMRRLNSDRVTEYGFGVGDMFNVDFDVGKNIELLPDIYGARDEIIKYIKAGKNILLVSDYDADGLMSASMMHVMFRDVLGVSGDSFKSVVNHRKTGNGFTSALVGRILELNKSWKVDMIITADHGSSDNQAYGVLKDNGISSIIVTDHHLIPEDNYPVNADFLINPQRKDSKYYRYVSGCFVAFALLAQVLKELRGGESSGVEELYPYVALSTISDVMSLDVPVNRQIVKVGLQVMNRLTCPMWRTMLSVLGVLNSVTPKDIGFKLAPMINTGNRMGVEEMVFDILISRDTAFLSVALKKLQKLNIQRKKTCKALTNSVKQELSDSDIGNSLVFVIDTDIHVNGILASSLGNMYSKPTMCFSEQDGVLVGSGRGVMKYINLHRILTGINVDDPSIMLGFGGHAGAAGCAINKDKLVEFKALFNIHTAKQIPDGYKPDPVYYDLEIGANELNIDLLFDIDTMGPYGKDWVAPVMKSRVKVVSMYCIGPMYMLTLQMGGVKYDAVWYMSGVGVDKDYIESIIRPQLMYDVYYNVSVSSYQGVTKLDIEIVTMQGVR